MIVNQDCRGSFSLEDYTLKIKEAVADLDNSVAKVHQACEVAGTEEAQAGVEVRPRTPQRSSEQPLDSSTSAA